MKNTKKIISSVLAVVLLFISLPFSAVNAEDKTPIATYSDCVYMINTDTGTVLYEKNAHKQTFPASLTKVMTAIVAVEYAEKNNLDLEKTMVKSPAYIYDELVGQNPSTADIRPGETVSLLDLLYALMLPSSCEAGSILADYVGGGNIQTFIDMMNQKAKALGANETHFTNAHGLSDTNQLSTVYDFYLITKEALSKPILATICDTGTYTMPKTAFHPNGWSIGNTNSFVRKGGAYYNENVHGVKTGSLEEVGKNLITNLSQDGYNYMVVSMGAPFKDPDGKSTAANLACEDAKNLYDWALKNYKLSKIAKKGDAVAECKISLSAQTDHVTLVPAKDVNALIPTASDSSNVLKKITLAKDVVAPIQKGDVLGKMELFVKDEVIETVDLVATDDVERSAFLYAMDAFFRFISQPVIVALICVLLLITAIFVICLVHYKNVKKRQNSRKGANRHLR